MSGRDERHQRGCHLAGVLTTATLDPAAVLGRDEGGQQRTVVIRRDRARGNRRRSPRQQARSASTRRRVSRVVGRADEMLVASRAPEAPARPARPPGPSRPARSGAPISAAEVRGGRARTQRGRSRRGLARRACAGASRYCRASARSRASARGRAAAPCAGLRPCLLACPGAAQRSHRARREDPLASRYAPTARPWVSVEVMSFAECTATSMRPSSSASSELLDEDTASSNLAKWTRAVAVARRRDRERARSRCPARAGAPRRARPA